MLFFNFLCLFYLMVLINSHTISKNIAYYDTVDDIVDSVHDLEYRREYKPKHDRFHRYYRKEEREDAPKAQKKEEPKQSTAAKLVSDSIEVTKLAKIGKPLPKTTKRLGFWHKFRFKGNEKKNKAYKTEYDVYKRKAMPRSSYRQKQYFQSRLRDRDSKSEDTTDGIQRRITHSIHRDRNTNVEKRKRSISNTTTTDKSISTRASSIFSPISAKTTSLLKLAKIKTYEPFHSKDNLTKSLTALTTKINDLKKEYGLKLKNTDTYPTHVTQSMLKNISTATSTVLTTTQSTTEDVDFLGTAQIEALLNDIKVKAVQMVAEQSPAITDIITNTVTETTFGADPILTHISTPGYALSTYISIDSDGVFSKRTASPTTAGPKANDTVVISNTEPTHIIGTRSINEDVYTIAQTIEDMLQRELKKVIKKVKGKVSPQLNEEIDHAKTTIKKETDKVLKKMTQSNSKQAPTAVTSPMSTPKAKTKARHSTKKKGNPAKQVRRTPNRSKTEKKKTSSASTSSTFDDYVMLTLFEQILSKTHQDNVMKMLTTPPTIASQVRDYFKLHKRTPQPLPRVSLKENIQKLYDDVILPDDLQDYGSKTTNPYNDNIPTESSSDDTSYEGLSNKISYNDYVNGYKHYLKFQKEQANQNFSNLVRYQAHRHHNVDDIGKFILNKIPQLPTGSRKKRFSDDDVMEDQDISTKSDDSWFKKHFYLFIDNGPPRKFHTSQTVELKSPITDLGSSGTESPITPRPKNKGVTENAESSGESNKSNKDESGEVNLEQLSKALDDRKSKEFTSIMPGQGDKMNDEEMETQNKGKNQDYDIFRGFGAIGLVDRLFKGKGRRTSKHNAKFNRDNTEELYDVDREKRNPKTNIENTHNLYASSMNTRRSTLPNVIETRNKNYGYVDVNLIPRPTAIVKLRDNNQKKSKLKKFFNKFRFRKRNKHKEKKKPTRAKREFYSYRVQRFNPLKKLKDLFKVKQIDRPSQSPDNEMPDYEMMTSHIDTFKPIKYDKVMSLEEIKGQIPNITEEMSQIHQNGPAKAAAKPSVEQSIEAPIASHIASPENMYDFSSLSNVSTPSLSDFSGSLKTSTRKAPKLKPHMNKPNTFKHYQEPYSGLDMSEITYDPATNKLETHYGATTPSLDDIRSEIDSLQMKLSVPEEKHEESTSSHSLPTLPTLPTTRFSNNFSAKKIFVPAHIQTVSIQPKVKAKADPKDIKIQTKLTRIAKFPLTHFSHDHNNKMNPVIDIPQIWEHAKEDRTSNEKTFTDVSQQKRIKKSANAYVTVHARLPTQNFNDFGKPDSYKPYPDYFNDLLMWHGDLLNSDKLTSPQWENILESLKQDSEVTTLSMMDMQRELMQMKDNLKIDESMKRVTPKLKKAKLAMKVKKDKTRNTNNNKKTQNIIKTVALKDNTVAKGKDIIIQGQAKYLHVIKQPESDSEKYIKASDLLKDLNKIYFKSPAIKYNIEDKIHDTKRNGEFWIENIKPKNKNTRDQDGSSVLFLDTTLLAYDDGADFLTERPKHKKMSKNSLVSAKPQHTQAASKPVAKTNPSPLQYFSTPLPMRMNDFEKFLKENQLDVQSVTTPLVGMPQFVVNKSPKKVTEWKKSHTKSNKPVLKDKAKLEKPAHLTTIYPIGVLYNNKVASESKSYDEFTIKNIYAEKSKNTDDKQKRKRFSELRNERFFTFEPFRKMSKVEKVKKKIKFFDKKATPSTTQYPDVHYTVIAPHNDDDMQSDVELTIINMNDIDRGYNNNKQCKCKPDEKRRTEIPTHATTKHFTDKKHSKTKTTKASNDAANHAFVQKIHNNLLYNQKHKDKNEKIPKTSVLDTTPNFENNVITDDISTTTFHPMIDHELFKNLNAKNPPKRVRISSHSYKYDIIYNNEPKRMDKHFNQAYKHGDYKLTPVTDYNVNDQYQSPYDSDISDHTDVEKELNWRMKSRRRRQVSGQLGSTKSYNYEGLETMMPNWREKRRLKLFSNIKGKLRTLLSKKSKTTSTPLKAKSPSKEEKHTTAGRFEEHKPKRQKKDDDIKGDGMSTVEDGFSVDYTFDIDRVVERATANSATTKKLTAMTKDNTVKAHDDMLFSDADIPYLPPMTSEDIPPLKDNYTSVSSGKLNKETTPITTAKTTTAKSHPLSSLPIPAKAKEKAHSKHNEEIYFEPSIYDNKIYYEPGTSTTKSSLLIKETLKAKGTPKLQTKPTETKLEKRDIQPAGKFTAKDVAALEVIVDLVKNTVNYEERDALQEFTENYYHNHPSAATTTTPVPKSTQGSNSIQVHIAIPYNLQVDKKRSLDSFKVRRVFAAKMFSPVDLEYQVQAFEETRPTTAATEPEDLMTPKMYLLIDANGSIAKGNFSLKPLPGNIDLSKVRVRQAATTKAFATQKAETTSGKAIGRVTLSKDFVAAVNKHLVQLYENLTAINESIPRHNVKIRETNMFSGPSKTSGVKTNYRRHINWDTVKKYFGHDRVCNCKCKANRTMCRACAASDAVISELIFEFENLAKYMNDHCTEIQTFFWMNPSGGKKLRDTVHKVDQTLHDYFKRVRGKCQGRTCKTFSTCIDKRSFVKKKKMPKKYIGDPLIADLQCVANDIEIASKLGICYNNNFIERGETLINTIGNCIRDVSKREEPNPTAPSPTATTNTVSLKKQIKNVYSLDNINVNIICKPESRVAIASSTAFTPNTEASLVTAGLNFMESPYLYDYDTDSVKYTKRKSFRNFFGNKKIGKKMNHIFTYYVTKDTTPPMRFKKRQITGQIESPLVSDSGGTFWQDYMKGNSLPQKFTSEMVEETVNDDHTLYPKDHGELEAKKSMSVAKWLSILRTTANLYPKKHVFQRDVNTTDYASVDTLSHNINELFKIFHNMTDLKEIEDMSTRTMELLEKHTTPKPKKNKTKTTTKIYNIIKSKLNFKHKPNAPKTVINVPKPPNKSSTVGSSEDNVVIPVPDNTQSLQTTTTELPSTTTETTIRTTRTTTAKSTTTTTEPATLKSSKAKEESTQTSHKEQESTQSESPKEESTSFTESREDANFKETNDVTEKSTASFLHKLKVATLDFFHKKANEFRKTTAITDSTEEIRKSRSSVTESSKLKTTKNKIEKPKAHKVESSKNADSQSTTDNNPTILIINEYDTEMEPNFGMNSPEGYNLDFERMSSSTDNFMHDNSRSLLLTILNYEAKKLNSELRRIKKDNDEMKSNDSRNSKRGIFRLFISTESTIKTSRNSESDYDIMRTLKDLELPTPKGLEENKGSGLLQKIANKFGVRVVQPKVAFTKLPPRQSTTPPPRKQPTTTKQKEKQPQMKESISKPKGENTPNTSKVKTVKVNPKDSLPEPKVTVCVNSNQEASRSHAGQVCDIDSTFKRVQEMLKSLPRKEVEQYIANKTCDKFKKLPNYFLIEIAHRKRRKKMKKYEERTSTERALKWDWIRNKRSINYDEIESKEKSDNKNRIPNKNKIEESNKIVNAKCNDTNTKEENKLVDSIKFIKEDNEYFEELERDKFGIYRSKKKRRKRADGINELETGMSNLTFSSKPNESYIMLGDTVIIQCASNKINVHEDNELRWLTDRKDMLTYDNVIVDGPKLMIKEVEARNLGEYTCKKGNTAQRKVRLTIITLPKFKVVFNPVYVIDQTCTYDDLRAVQLLGPMMGKEICSEDQLCGVQIEEPVCLQDRVSSTAYVRMTAKMSVLPGQGVECSARCRRDLHDSLALMAAADAPALAAVKVMIMYDDMNKTLVPSSSSDSRRTIITHTLRRKG
ncbi:uncharacterized protein LOC135084814 [Ostrinia nubilalis]|uniref:uncharacterized protein LOC135084814 n=1 Tax=Ostrinia nubilalis TaxID=29057 RepID=UPI0030823338